MEESTIRAKPEIRCGRCDAISQADVMEGLDPEHFQDYACQNCGRLHEITLKIEWFED